MPIKQTVPTNSSDSLQFGNATTPVAAQVTGAEVSTGNGYLAMSTTASGTVTERVRVASTGGVSIGTTTDLGTSNLYVNGSLVTSGDVFESQPTPTALAATATLTIAQMLTNIITVTSATAVTLTLPTGTLTDAGILSGLLPINASFDWSIINLGSSSGTVQVAAGTGHTVVGMGTAIAISTSAWFRTRKTAANTFVTYKVG